VTDFWMLAAGLAAICMSFVYAAGVGRPPFDFADTLLAVHFGVFLIGGIALVLQAFWMQVRVML
jgi:hypothetical protein